MIIERRTRFRIMSMASSHSGSTSSLPRDEYDEVLIEGIDAPKVAYTQLIKKLDEVNASFVRSDKYLLSGCYSWEKHYWVRCVRLGQTFPSEEDETLSASIASGKLATQILANVCELRDKVIEPLAAGGEPYFSVTMMGHIELIIQHLKMFHAVLASDSIAQLPQYTKKLDIIRAELELIEVRMSLLAKSVRDECQARVQFQHELRTAKMKARRALEVALHVHATLTDTTIMGEAHIPSWQHDETDPGPSSQNMEELRQRLKNTSLL